MIPGYKPDNLLPKRSKYYDDSVLINRKHIEIFTNWIKQDEKNTIDRYYFKLLYRASRDGNTAAAFHQKCDNKGLL